MCQAYLRGYCLGLFIYYKTQYFDFLNIECRGTTIISINRWHHVAFVYDYPNRMQYVYLNGELECIGLSRSPLLVTESYITIGAHHDPGPSGFQYLWNGLIDQLIYISHVKSAMEILDDATLVAYYQFNSVSMNLDSGPNKIDGVN